MKNCPDCPSFYLKEIPTDVHDILLDRQVVEKKKRRNSNSKNLENIIYTIIREWWNIHANGGIIETESFNIITKAKISEKEKMYIINELNKRMV